MAFAQTIVTIERGVCALRYRDVLSGVPGGSHTDQRFTYGFDTIFRSEDNEIVPLPHRVPYAFAERWVRSVREECLDQLLIWNEAHLRRVLKEYVTYYNARRPYQGLGQNMPEGWGLFQRKAKSVSGMCWAASPMTTIVRLPD